MKTKLLGLVEAAVCMLLIAAGAAWAEESATGYAVYDEDAYTEFVENSMHELDALYLKFCASCGVDPAEAIVARKEFLVKVRDLMQYMNGRFDALDPKKGAALSPTETLVSIHSMTMLVDILAATQIEDLSKHPYIE